MKASHASQVRRFTDIPNIGTAMAKDFALLGISDPAQLALHEPIVLYKKLCRLTHTRQDPCVLDTFIAAVDFMRGAQAKPWWHYTAQRKQTYQFL